MMKSFLTTLLLTTLICLTGPMTPAAAQEKSDQGTTVKKIVNTLKERITLQGYMHMGYTYDDAGTGKTNTFDIKRAILIAKGRITDHWTCAFQYSFANSARLLEAYTEYSFLPELTLRVGQFKTMFSMENPYSPSVMELINVYSQAALYLAGYNGSDGLYGSNSGRDIGILLYGDLCKGLIRYHLGVMNGQGINRKDGNNQKDVVGTLAVCPLKWLTVQGSFIKGKGCAVGTNEVNPDIQIGDNYDRNRWAIGTKTTFDRWTLRAEYLNGKDGQVRSHGAYATTCINLWRTIDLIASLDYFDRNKAMDDYQTNYVGGMQWWFYPKCRVQLQYTYRDSHLRGGSNLLQAQVQVRF